MKFQISGVSRKLVALTTALTLGCCSVSPLYAGHDPFPGKSKGGKSGGKHSGPSLPVVPLPGLPVPSVKHLPGVPLPVPGLPVPSVKHLPAVPLPVPGVVPVPVPVPVVRHRPPVVVHGPAPVYRPGPPPPHYHNRHWVRRHEPFRPRYYGRYYPILPAAAFSFFIGGAAFYYSSGLYYRPRGSGYIVVSAPIGARIHTLPDRCSYFDYRGDRCYACDDVFYRQEGPEYVVIERPTRWDDVVQIGDYVRVTTNALNIRSGPGTNFYVIGQVSSGDVVEVNGMENGWFYIQFDNGTFGWVMQQYTIPYEVR